MVAVAQWPKASGCGPEDRGFNPLQPPQIQQVKKSKFQIPIH